jgi:hypothetical protein
MIKRLNLPSHVISPLNRQIVGSSLTGRTPVCYVCELHHGIRNQQGGSALDRLAVHGEPPSWMTSETYSRLAGTRR